MNARLSTAGMYALLILVCIGMGLAAIIYGGWVDQKLSRIVVVPAILLMAILFCVNKTFLFLLLVGTRASVDPLIVATSFGPITAGAFMNALIIFIAVLLMLEKRNAATRVIMSLWAPVVLALLLAVVRGPDIVAGTRIFLGYLTFAAVFAVPFYLKPCRNDLRFCVNLCLLSSLVPVLYGFVEFALRSSPYGDRIASSFSHPNIFAFFLLLNISLAFYALKSPLAKPSLMQRALLALYIGAMMVDLILTQTRSAWAACFAMFLIYGLLFERRYLVYITAASLVALTIPAIQDRLLDLNSGAVYWTDGYAPLNSYEWRKLLWADALGWMSWTSMPLGYGLGAFSYYSTEFFSKSANIHWEAHNVYVQWFFEAGVLGLLCSTWLYYRMLSMIKTGLKRDKLGTIIVLGILLEYLVVSYSDNMLAYLTFNWYFYFVMGTVCSIALARSQSAAVPISKQPLNIPDPKPALAGSPAARRRGLSQTVIGK